MPTVFGYHDHNFLTIAERLTDHLKPAERKGPRERIWRVRAREVVLATGAIERPLVFANNDRPGVMLASAAARYACDFGVLPGERIAVFANNDSAYANAALLREAGATIVAIVDMRAAISEDARRLASECGGELLVGHAVVATEGGKGLTGFKVQKFDAATGSLTGDPRVISADLLAVSGGWSPAIHLASQAGQKPEWNDTLQAFMPPAPTQNWKGAGAFNGIFDTASALADGRAAGEAASGARARRPRQ